MLRRTLTLLAVLSVVAPIAPRADDWDDDRDWEEDYTEQQQWSDPRPDDYDVSVDLNVSGSVTFDTFHGALTPYGEWVSAGGYGRVWRPRVAAGWRPYYYGRWEWTNEGWLWVSDEPWGWAAYHYGRWTYDSYYGWVWVPGYQWAPAWVAWRYSGDVVGWAPLGPGVSVYVSTYPFVDYWWTFVPCGSFVSVPVYSVAYAPGYTRRYFHATAPAPPLGRGVRGAPGRPGQGPARPAWGGPAPRVIEQRIGRPVTPVRVVPAPSPGAARARPGEVSIYRPDARPSAGRGEGARGQRGTQAPGTDRRAIVPGDGRGAPAAPPPARGGDRGNQAAPPPARGGDRGNQGAMPPGRGGDRGGPGYAPPARGGDRGDQGATPPARGGDRGDQGAAPPARGEDRGGPGYAPPSRGGDRGGSGYAPSPRGGDRGGSGYAPPERSGGRGAATYGAPAQGGGRGPTAYAGPSRAMARGGAGYAPSTRPERGNSAGAAPRGQPAPATSAAPAQRSDHSARAAPSGRGDGGSARSSGRAGPGARGER